MSKLAGGPIIRPFIIGVIGCAMYCLSARAATASGSSGRHVRLYVLAGQSNAVGYNDYREYKHGKEPFPAELKNQPDVLFWDDAAGAWTTLSIGKTQGSSENAFGPEIAFAHEMARKAGKDQIAIVKCAEGGTGIARSSDYGDYIPSLKGFNDGGMNWHPPGDGKTAGALYKRLVERVNRAEKALKASDRSYTLSAFLWMQGEHEAGISRKMAGDYGRLLKSFMQSVRHDLRAPKLPFVVGEINSHTWAFGDLARSAQAKACKEDGRAILVKTTDLSRSGSGGAAHFDADGMLELGNRFAAAVEGMRVKK